MKKLISFDEWEIDLDMPFVSGASKKHWLVNHKTRQRGIFKYPKVTSKNTITGEYWAECLAYELACVLEIPCAKVNIGTYNGEIGSMSYMLLEEDEELYEGISYISKEYPKYNSDTFVEQETNKWYSLEMILQSIEETGLKNDFFIIPLFDALIGNTDRHHSNWGIVINKKTKKKHISPLYDNGSSLCSIVNESKINISDTTWFNAQIDSRSRSRIRIEHTKKEPTHFQVIEYLSQNYYLECSEYVSFNYLMFEFLT